MDQPARPALPTDWSEEIDRRLAAYDRGETATVNFEAAVDHVRQALAEHRARSLLED